VLGPAKQFRGGPGVATTGVDPTQMLLAGWSLILTGACLRGRRRDTSARHTRRRARHQRALLFVPVACGEPPVR
jgi:hypothetical protein